MKTRSDGSGVQCGQHRRLVFKAASREDRDAWLASFEEAIATLNDYAEDQQQQQQQKQKQEEEEEEAKKGVQRQDGRANDGSAETTRGSAKAGTGGSDDEEERGDEVRRRWGPNGMGLGSVFGSDFDDSPTMTNNAGPPEWRELTPALSVVSDVGSDLDLDADYATLHESSSTMLAEGAASQLRLQ